MRFRIYVKYNQSRNVVPNLFEKATKSYQLGQAKFYKGPPQNDAHEFSSQYWDSNPHPPNSEFNVHLSFVTRMRLPTSASICSRYFNGKNIIVKALRPLKPKEVVAENYGLVFSRKHLIDRQKVLSARYWFECKCRACVENWPLMETLEKYPIRIR